MIIFADALRYCCCFRLFSYAMMLFAAFAISIDFLHAALISMMLAFLITFFDIASFLLHFRRFILMPPRHADCQLMLRYLFIFAALLMFSFLTLPLSAIITIITLITLRYMLYATFSYADAFALAADARLRHYFHTPQMPLLLMPLADAADMLYAASRFFSSRHFAFFR